VHKYKIKTQHNLFHFHKKQ
jgi:transcriptional regulator with AAA-type ATPase domain